MKTGKKNPLLIINPQRGAVIHKDITLNQIIEKMCSLKFPLPPFDIIKTIVSRYIQIMMTRVIEGRIWFLPYDLGEIKVLKKLLANRKKRRGWTWTPKQYYEDRTSKGMGTNRLGYYYLTVTAGKIAKQGYYYTFAPKRKKMLSKLISQGKDYRYEE